MRILASISFLFLLFSCSTNTETKKAISASNEINKYIQKRYKTAEVSSTFGSETKNGKEESYFRISVGKSTVIDNSKSSPELFASDIAFRLFCDMDKAERKATDIISVKITQNNQVTETKYSPEQLLEANVNLLWLDGFFRLVAEKEYDFAKAQFNTKLVDTSSVNLNATYETLSQNLGKLKNQELQGFEITEAKVDSKTYRVLVAHYISFYEKQYTLSKYALLMDEPDQKLVNMDIK